MLKTTVAQSSRKTPGLARRAPRLMALEQRFMFDGAAVDTAAIQLQQDASGSGEATVIEALAPRLFDAKSGTAAAAAAQLAEAQVRAYLSNVTPEQLFKMFNGGQSQASEQWLARAQALLERVQDGTHSLQIRFLGSDVMGIHQAAYTQSGPDGRETLFLNADWWSDPASTPQLVSVLVEELGHSFDAWLNPEGDTPGDEGERLAAVVAGLPADTQAQPLSLTENDQAILMLDGVAYAVEHASFKFTTAYRVAPEFRYYAEKEQESNRFYGESLGVASITDNTSGGTFSGNDVVVALTIGSTTYNGWISRPIKDQGIVRGFYFWYDPSFTTFTLATNDGNQDGDSNAADNQGFLLVVDQSWFSAVLAKAPVHNNGTTATNVYEVGSSSDQVDSALNGAVSAANTAPAAVADTNTITQGTATATGNVLTNDSDAEGNSLSVTEFAINGKLYTAGSTATLSGVGTLVINANGTYTFTPVAGYTGTVPVATYKVSDGITSSTATLTISVTPVNAAPDAVNDTGAVTEDVTHTGNLITNDTDANGDGLTVTGYTFTPVGGSLTSGTVGANTIIPGVGTLRIYSDGSYSFTPAPDYDGAVPVITYTISDGNGGTDTATLTLTITGVSDGPTLTNDTSTSSGASAAIEQSGDTNGTAGQTATGNVLTNDTAGSGSLTVTQVGQSAASQSVTASTTSANGTAVVGRYGTLTMGANGSYVYVVADSDPAVQALRVTGQTLTETFTYQATNSSGLSATATLTVTIDGRNDKPVAVNDYNIAQETTTVNGSGFAYTGFSATGNVVTNDTDVDGSANGETKTISGISIQGSATISSYTSPTASTKLIFRGDNGFTSVGGGEELYVLVGTTYYLVFDSGGTKVDVTSRVKIEGTTNDYEITLSGTPAKYSDGSGGYIAISDLSYFNSKSVGFQNSNNLTQDGGGNMKTATSANAIQAGSVVTIGASYTGTIAAGMTVSGTGITDTTVSSVTYTSGVITSVTLSKSYSQSVLSGTLTFSKTGTVGSSITGEHGSLTLNSDGSYTYTPTTDNAALGAGETATEAFNYTMVDTAGLTSAATLYITVLGASSGAPSAVNDTHAISEGVTSVSKDAATGVQSNDTKDAAATVIQISSSKATDTTLDGNNDFEVAGLYGTLKIKADGSYVYTLDNSNAAVNALHGSETLVETFQYVLSDPSGGTYTGVDAATLSITINGVNDLPVGGKLPDGTDDPSYDTVDARYEITTPEDTPIKGQVKAYDSDDTSLTYAAGTGPTNGLVVVNSDGSYTYTPNGNYTGNDQFTVTVSDGRGGTATITVYVTVTPVNDAPFLDLDGSASGTGYATSYTLGGSAVPIADTDRTITDVDDTNIESATIVLTNPQTGDALNVGTLPAGITADTSVPGQITLTGSATLANYQTALRAITFSTTGGNRTDRSVSVVVNDGNVNSNTAYTTLRVNLTPLAVEGVTVNEASPYAVFRVTGASGQTVTLALEQTGNGSSHAVLGMDTTDAGTDKPLQYLNSSNVWTDYTPGATLTMSGTTLLVRTAIRQDSPFEGLETYRLAATDDANVTARGQGGIIDDGTGAVFLAGNITFTPSASGDAGYPTLDDDRTVSVRSYGPVNEASQYAMFTVTAVEGYALDLQLQAASSGTAATRTGFTFEYSTNGTTWTTYTWDGSAGNQPTVPAGGKVYVRVDIRSERDTNYEGAETFALQARYTSNTAKSAAADTTIVDDGSGTKYPGTLSSGDPVLDVTSLDDDRVLTVSSPRVNEGSPYVVFTVTGKEGQQVKLALGDGTATTENGTAPIATDGSEDYGPALQYWNGSAWTDYTAGSYVTMADDDDTSAGEVSKLLVRTKIHPDALYENDHTFTLTATNTGGVDAVGTATIDDSGGGTKYPDASPTGTDPLDPSTVTDSTNLDDDRPTLTVTGKDNVSEGSPSVFDVVLSKAYTADQVVTLTLGHTSTETGDYGTTMVVTYTNASNQVVTLNVVSGGTFTLPALVTTFQVRVTTTVDSDYEGPETFTLTAAVTNGPSGSDSSTILDDGTGQVYRDDGTADLQATPDDDRPVRVNNIEVNENSPWAVFRVNGSAGQSVTLELQNDSDAGTANANLSADIGTQLQYFNGTNWVDYSSAVTLPAGGELLVRVAVNDDDPYEGAETFQLKVTPSGGTVVYGTATILDDGTGSIYPNNTTGNPDPDAVKDDDRPVRVNSIEVNEASPYAVFTVTGTGTQGVVLSLQNDSNLGTVDAALGTDTTHPLTSGVPLQVFNGTAWVDYTPASTVNLIDGRLLVRTALVNDSPYEGAETFQLKAVPTGGTAVYGTATIFDDGTGSIYPNNTTGNPDLDAPKNDDRPVYVNNIEVNENSPWAVFRVNGTAGQSVTLSLQNDNDPNTANALLGTDTGTQLQYFNGTSWVDYTGAVTLPAGGELLVRVAVNDDDPYEGAETFQLKVTPSGGNAAYGTATILDDGTGSIYPDNTTGNPDLTAVKDDDRPVRVNNIQVNEASPYAVFTVTGTGTQGVVLSLQNDNDPATANAALGTDTTHPLTSGVPLQVFNGTAWVDYTPGSTVNLINGQLLVRTAIINDSPYEGAETFQLAATPSGGNTAYGTATILDDGTGDIYPNNTTGSTDSSAAKNDDRPVTVNSIRVNEASPYAVFTVTAASTQGVVLSLQNDNDPATADARLDTDNTNPTTSGRPLQVFDGTNWVNYTPGSTVNLLAVPAGGRLLVRTAIVNDTVYEGAETFQLRVVPSGGTAVYGTATILDDGTGDIYPNNTTGSTDPNAAKNDDRPSLTSPVPPPPAPVAPPAAPPPPAPPAPPATFAPPAPPPPPAAPPVQGFASALQPLAPKPVTAEVVPISLGEAVTSGSGYQIPVSESAPAGLTINRGITDQFVQSTNATTKVSMPFDAFIHSNKDAVIKLEAKQADNAPLPAWVQFDPATGVFEVTPPPNFRGKIDLKVVARDDDGREATAIFQMFIGEQTTTPNRPQGRESFSEKLRLAGKRSVTLVRVSDAAPMPPVRETQSVRARAG